MKCDKNDKLIIRYTYFENESNSKIGQIVWKDVQYELRCWLKMLFPFIDAFIDESLRQRISAGQLFQICVAGKLSSTTRGAGRGSEGEETGHVPPTLTEVGPGNASNFRLASCRHQNASNSFCARAPPRTLVGAHNFLRLCPCIAISWPMDIRLPNLIMVFYFIMFTCSPSFTLAALHHLMYMYIHTMC